jgi:hypothetical protein
MNICAFAPDLVSSFVGRGDLLPAWPTLLISAVIVVIWITLMCLMSASSYGDWVRSSYEKREKLQTLFGDENEREKPRGWRRLFRR